MKNQIELFGDYLNLNQTDTGQAYHNVQEARRQIATLQERLGEVQRNFELIKTQKVKVELDKQKAYSDLLQARQQLEGERRNYQQLANENRGVSLERDRLGNAQNLKQNQIDDLARQVREANLKARQVVGLEKQVQGLNHEMQRLNATRKMAPEIEKILVELGPVPSQISPRQEDGDIRGALDVQENIDGLEPEGEQVDAVWVEYAKAYNQRYGEQVLSSGAKKSRTPVEIAKAGFNFAFTELLKMAKEGDQIKINASEETGYTIGRQAVYRYIVLDLIKGGKVYKPGCKGYELQINNNVAMFPSHPEKILKFKEDAKGRQPEAVYTCKRQDEFTPSYDDLGLRDGVDPVSTKWIYVQLNEEEKDHLFNLLMAPIIPNDNEGLLRTIEFMRDRQNPRVQLIEKEYELIADLGTTFEIKFRDNVFADCWGELATLEIAPFVKAEDIELDLTRIDDPDMVKVNASKPVAWELDREVLDIEPIYRPGRPAQQPRFLDLIEAAKKKYHLLLPTCLGTYLPIPRSKEQSLSGLNLSKSTGNIMFLIE